MALKLSATQYAHSENVVSQDENTFVGWFAPSFSINDSSQRFFFDVDNVDYSLYNTGSGNTLTATADGRSYSFTASSWTTNVWIHVAFAFQKSGDIHKVWINGSPLTSSGNSGSWGSTSVGSSDRLFIGKQSASGGNFTGKCAEVAVYNRMLTNAEVLELSKAFSPIALPTRTALTNYWDFIRPTGAMYPPKFGEMPATIVGFPAIEDHPRMFYSSNQFLYEPQQPLAPPVSGRISESYLAGSGSNVSLLGNEDWSNPENITLDDEQYASITLTTGGISKTLKSGTHGFNIPPQGVIQGVQIEVQFTFDNDFLNGFQIYDGTSWGLPVGQVEVSGSGTANVIYGDSTETWGLTLTPAKINNANFGFGFVVQDSANVSPTVNVDFIKITIHWSSVGAVTYTESPTGGLLGSGIGGTDFRSGTGGATVGGAINATSSETRTPSGGVRGGGIAVTSPYLIGEFGTELHGGLVAGTTADWNIMPGVSGGLLAGGIAIKGYSSPVPSSGVLLGGSALLTPYIGDGGARASGEAEYGSRTPIGGAATGGSADTLFEYNPTPESGTIGGGTNLNDTYTETPSGGAVSSGNALPRPHYIGILGTELQGGATLGGSIKINGDPEGGVSGGGTANVTGNYTPVIGYGIQFLTLGTGAFASGSHSQTFIDFISSGGGALAGGSALVGVTITPLVGAIAGGPTPPNNQVEYVERNPSVSGGAKAGGQIQINLVGIEGTGGIEIDGPAPRVRVNMRYVSSGNSNSGAGVIIEAISIDSPRYAINVNGSFDGSTITIDGEIQVNDLTVDYRPIGVQLTVGGQATPISADYGLTIATGGIEITGYSAAWTIRRTLEPRISDALCMKSDNIYKAQYLTTETQLAEEYACGADKNPVLCEIDFSTTVLQKNKVQGGYLPTATVVRQKKHLPTPKQSERNRGTDLARLT